MIVDKMGDRAGAQARRLVDQLVSIMWRLCWHWSIGGAATRRMLARLARLGGFGCTLWILVVWGGYVQPAVAGDAERSLDKSVLEPDLGRRRGLEGCGEPRGAGTKPLKEPVVLL